MARGAQVKPPGRPQTLRAARRAYQKAGRAPSFTAAQVRAATRAVEQEKRAKDILAKEKRAQELKRKREEQEAKQKEELKKLVEQGKLPEESLWGKVRSSQPRLHNFFSIPQRMRVEGNIHKSTFSGQGLREGVRARSAGSVDEEPLDRGRTLAPVFVGSQSTTPSPAPRKEDDAKECDENSVKVVLKQTHRDIPAAEGTFVQSDVQLSFSASQFFSDIADDKDLEAELNGLTSPEDKLDHLSASKTIDYVGSKNGPQPRKRKASDETHITSPSPKTIRVRVVFAHMSASMLNSRQLNTAGALCASSSTTHLSDTNSADNLGNVPTASQMKAIFWSEDFADDGDDSDKENILPARSVSQNNSHNNDAHDLTAALKESQMSPQRLACVPRNVGQVPEKGHGLISVDSGFRHDSDEDFGCDLDAEMLNLPTQPSSASVPRSLKSRPWCQSMKQATPPQSQVQDPLSGTQETIYDFDSMDGEELAGLADQFSSS
jgi:hypothetical protein